MVCVGVLVVYLLLTSTPPAPLASCVPTTAGMVGRMVTSLSARVADTLSGTSGIIKDGTALTGPTPSNVDCADCDGAQTSESASDAITDAQKKEVSRATKQWVDSHNKCVVMIFAPWCPHCKTAIPLMLAMAKDAPEVPFLIVNADSVDRPLLSEGGMVTVPHFPFYACKTTAGEPLTSIESPEVGIEMCRAEAAKAGAALVSGKRASLDPEEELCDPFKDF